MDPVTHDDGIARQVLMRIFRHSLLWTPERHAPSDWTPHVPFAFWIVDVLRPRRIVELGTHTGVSYSAFCQAVKTLGVTTSCFAIACKYDDQADFHADDIYHDFETFHHARYGRFSRLVRSTFDQALQQFEDSTIDLLHIDGLHTYDRVRDAYQSWLPKLTPNAVVLFHHTNVAQNGVFPLWNEITSQRPSFSFVHGHGLGVLGLGQNYPEVLHALFDSSNHHTAAIRHLFGLLGSCTSHAAKLGQATDELRELREESTTLRKALGSATNEAHRLRQMLAIRTVELTSEIQRLRQNITTDREELSSLKKTLGSTRAEARRLRQTLALRTDELARNAVLIDRIRKSYSWRITKPLRAARRVLVAGATVPSVLRSEFLQLAQIIYRNMPLPARQKYYLRPLLFCSIRSPAIGTLASQTDSCETHSPTQLVEGLEFPASATPSVSIIINTSGSLPVTAACLRAVARYPPAVAFEVIVVEDCSGDHDMDVLDTVPGLRFERNEHKVGASRARNRVAGLARGEFLHFLSSYTQVTKNWLDEMIWVFHSAQTVGLVGSKVVLSDGRLQHAGGIVWRDGSAWHFGHFYDPDAPEYNYVRETDYCSGTSLMIRRALFTGIGCFDDRYAAGYCEDAGLAFKVREAGYRVVYQPTSVVVNCEDVSRGTRAGKGIKAYQNKHQGRFYERWREELERHHFPKGESVFTARDRSRHKRCVLVIDQFVPQPDRDAGSRTMFHVLQVLAGSGFNVKFWPQNLHRDLNYTRDLQNMGIEVLYGTARSISFKSWLRENGHYIHYAILSRPNVAIDFINDLRVYSNATIIYYGHDIHHLRLRLGAAIEETNQETESNIEKMEEMEREVWSLADVIYYPSEEETKYVLRASCFHYARTMPAWGFDSFAPPEDPHLSWRADVLFVAGFGHAPNEDAAYWFVDVVYPIILARLPHVRLWLVGSNPSPNIELLGLQESITVTGSVSDEELALHYENCRVAVAPLRYGGGVKGKVVEAMRFGVPVVTTAFGVQGMSGLPTIPIYSEPEGFAAAVITLLTDDTAWRQQRRRQGEYVRQHFSSETLRDFLLADLK